ncbi:MAG: type II secretion system secretin GspD [Deltaproteobacteria bacterium]|nr:type II secretion system secretin GspD [Deltaproteobacteria bacterium]
MGRVFASVTVAAVCWATAAAYAQSPPPAGAVNVAPAPSPSPASTDDSVVLNFEGADIREVIHSLADALGINYQIDPRIQGQVTIRTTGTIAKQDLFPVFNQILRSNGISAVRVGDIYQIIPVAEAKTKAIIPNTTGERGRVKQQDTFVIEVVPIEHVAAQEMVNVIQPFVTPGGDVIPYSRANLLIITDLESNVARLKDLVATFDRDAFRDLRARVYKIEHANIEELGEELLAILDTYGVTPASAEERGVYVIPLPRLNSVVVVAFNPTAFAEVDRWMKVLDAPPEEGAGRLVHVYAVENAKAADLADILNQLYGGGAGGGSNTALGRAGYTPFGSRQRGGAQGAARPNAPGGAGRVGAAARPAAPAALQSFEDFAQFEPLQQIDTGNATVGGGASGGSGTGRGRSARSLGGGGIGGAGQGRIGGGGVGIGGGLGQGAQGYVLAGGQPGDIFRQEVHIVADQVSNSIVILATKKDYGDISEVLRKLDVVPRQVLIEVLVAEVDLGDDLKFGIEFSVAQSSRKNALGRITGGTPSSTTTTTNTAGSSIFDLGSAFGLRSTDIVPVPGNGVFGVISDNRNFAAVLNAMAGKNKLKVLSSPHIMTADNHEAHILVGNEVPIITTQSNAIGVQTNNTTNILQNIQYRDTGVIMTVLPQVNSEGLVNMQIRQEVSQIASATTGGIASPTFSTRESETTVVVQSGETIVIGGIIDDSVDRSRTGVPFLMDIPVLGRAFRVDTDNVKRTELVVLLTPHVVRDRQESRSATEAFVSRLIGMRRDIKRNDSERPDYGGPVPRSDDAGAPRPIDRR